MPDSKKTTANKKSATTEKKPDSAKAAAKPAAKKSEPAKATPAPMKTTTNTAKKPPSKPATTPSGASKKNFASTTSEVSSYIGFEPYREDKGEEYMNDRQGAHFRGILQAWKRALMEEVDRTLQHMQEEVANYADPNDRATQESDFTLELRTRDRERKLIKKIDEALQALDDGEYGFCESCGIEIGIRRLEARPTATLCIDCKTLDEIREKQRAG
jgi:DnaK suppressor protein